MKTRKLTSRLLVIGLSLLSMANLCVGELPNSKPTERLSSTQTITLTITPTVTPTMTVIPGPDPTPPGEPVPTPTTPSIHDVSLNSDDYPNRQIPKYGKLEITFQVDTLATNLHLPFDAEPPPGVQPGIGISVEALITPDNWQTVYHQPAFYYQDFLDQVREGQEWFYPSGNYSWKVRFSPPSTGSWQLRLAAQDSGGSVQSGVYSFAVADSGNKGFVRVSKRDPRYFELEDGTYFPGLGYNMNFDQVSWNNPVLDNEENFQVMAENGVQLVRIWLSQWGIFGPSWNPWNAIDPELHGQSVPFSGLTFEQPYPGSDVAMRLDVSENPCMFLGFMKAPSAVLPHTRYRVRIRYRTDDISGPSLAGSDFGLVAKTGDWLWGQGNDCQEPGSGQVVTSYGAEEAQDWQILEGSLFTGNSSFLPFFYLVLENVSQGTAFIDHVWIEEDLGDGQFGPNILSKPWMAHHLYMDQRNSYAFDKVIRLAEQYRIYLRPVIMEKNDWIFNRIDTQGRPIPDDRRCEDSDPKDDPSRCPGNRWFYGPGREMSKVRWLQQAWWRYLQARWGYSTAIHSWELLNEGDPNNELHYLLADEFGKYMHQFAPDDHLVSTSFWHSFPKDAFWANPAYPEMDFADIHRYVDQNSLGYKDTSLSTLKLSAEVGAKQPGGVGKPVIRGEIGFTINGTEPPSDELLADSNGLWLHNFLWAGINSGGLIESYWYANYHIYRRRPDGKILFDHRDQFGALSRFLKDIPLNNGFYQDAQATATNPKLRVVGQKDLVNGRVHLWIQNIDHTWVNVVEGVAVPDISGTIQISGFKSGQNYLVHWWDPYAREPAWQVVRQEIYAVQADQTISLDIEKLASDLAVTIQPTRP